MLENRPTDKDAIARQRFLAKMVELAPELPVERMEHFAAGSSRCYNSLSEILADAFESRIVNMSQLTIDRGLSIEELVAKAGVNDTSKVLTSKHIPKYTGSEKAVVCTYVVNRSMDPRAFCREIASMGFRHSDIWELLAFACQSTELTESGDYGIVAMGTKVHGSRTTTSIHNKSSRYFSPGLCWGMEEDTDIDQARYLGWFRRRKIEERTRFLLTLDTP